MPSIKTTIQDMVLRAIPTDDDPVLVIGHGRSGTTWIGNTLAFAPRTLVYHEPCRPHHKTVGDLNPVWFRHIPADGFDTHFADRLDRAFRALTCDTGTNWTADRSNWRIRLGGHRLVIKEVAAMSSIGWVAAHYGRPRTLFVVRHPCAMALSEHVRSIDPTRSIELILADPGFDAVLTDDQKKILRTASTPFEGYGAVWAARNSIFDRTRHDHAEWRLAHYEDLAAEPVARFTELYAWAGLEMTEDVRRRIEATTTTEEAGHYATTKDAKAHIEKWRGELTADQVDQVMRTMRAFGTSEDLLPHEADRSTTAS
jgi:hypothetical protein